MSIRSTVQHYYYRIMSPIWQRSFQPRVVNVSLPSSSFRFYIGTRQAADWYDPPKAHTLAEYAWVLANIDFAQARVIDVGAHHGHYSLVFAKADPTPERVVAVEPHPANCALIEVNAALNDADIDILQASIAKERGTVNILPRANSRIFKYGKISVSSLHLSDVMKGATVVKLDVEGAEFEIIPDQIDEMPDTHTWIIELHPAYGNPRSLTREFLDRGFQASMLDREKNSVTQYEQGDELSHATSMFFQRTRRQE